MSKRAIPSASSPAQSIDVDVQVRVGLEQGEIRLAVPLEDLDPAACYLIAERVRDITELSLMLHCKSRLPRPHRKEVDHAVAES